jgi:hypothetical protein
MTMYGNPNSLSSVADHYGTNAVFFFYLETVLFLCFKHRAVFFLGLNYTLN